MTCGLSSSQPPSAAVDPGSSLCRVVEDVLVEIVPYEQKHLDGVLTLCSAENWPSFPEDPARAHRVLTAPGVTATVALENERVIGFAYLQSDGEIQAHLSLIAVDRSRRREGIGRKLVMTALAWSGGERIDLVTDTSEEFYEALLHRRMSGFRLYPEETHPGDSK